MPKVPVAFSEKTEEEIEQWGYLGLSEQVVFSMLGMTPKQADFAKTTDRWKINYRKGLARREMELAKTLMDSKDSQLIKELLKSTSLVEKKLIDDNVEFKIEAPAWVTKQVKKTRKSAKANN